MPEEKPASCSTEKNGKVGLFVEGGKPPYKFRWSTGDTAQNLEQVPSGTYNVKITDQNQCYVTAAFNVPNLYEKCKEISIYPNPFREQIMVELFHHQPETTVHVQLTDLMGKIGYKQTYAVKSENQKIIIDISEIKLPAGLYILNIQSQSLGSQSFKLVKIL